jgi:hypothetical protein
MKGRSKRTKILKQAQTDHYHHQQFCPAAQHHYRSLSLSPKKDDKSLHYLAELNGQIFE